MTNEEAIKTIEVAIAEVEWNYPMNYAVAFEMAIKALKKQEQENPCDVGDWLYLPCCGKIIELQVFEILIKHIFVDYSTGVIKNIIALNENGARMKLKCKDIGKTVFLTREEAEKALKEREANE